MNGKAVNIGVHTIAWVFFLSLPIFLFPELLVRFEYSNCYIFNYLLSSGLLVVLFYFNYYVAVPNYYFREKYAAFIGLHIAFIIGVFLLLILFNLFIGPCGIAKSEEPFKTLSRGILPRYILVLFASLLMRINERLKSIDAQKMKTELQLLRAQINPHFLFNVLNTIYGQAIIKSEHTADSIARLADLMRYSLTEANVSKISLDKELVYIENYIALQKLRLTEKTKVDFQINGDVHTRQIPPMLFMPFIENAFKYGVSNEVETSIKISIKIKDQAIELLVDNTKLPNRTILGSSNQIGIKNVKSRLELIYGSRYTLNLKDGETDYSVALRLLI